MNNYDAELLKINLEESKILTKEDKETFPNNGRKITYGIVTGLNMYFADDEPWDFPVFTYPSYILLPDKVTEEIIGNLEKPVLNFQEVAMSHYNVRDYFARENEDLMGVLENNTLCLYLSPYSDNPTESVELGEEPRIVMLEWLSEAEHQEWNKYFSDNEKVINVKEYSSEKA